MSSCAAESLQQQTKIEDFCVFVDSTRGVNTSSSSSSPSCAEFLNSIEFHCRNVANEFATLARGERDSNSIVMRSYCHLVQDAVTELVEKSKTFISFTSSWSHDFSLVNEKDVMRVKRALAGLLSLTENFSPPQQQRQWQLLKQILLSTERESAANRHSFSRNNASFSTLHCLQKQTALAANAIIVENFRLPGNIFDPRKAFADVSEILQQLHSDNNKNSTTTTTCSSKQPKTKAQPPSPYHIKSILPFVGASSSSSSPSGYSLKKQVRTIADMFSRLRSHSDSSDKDDDDDGDDDRHRNQQCTLISHFAPELAITLQQLLGDVTNLLFRVSSQTPKNSPNCAFLTFLICDVSFFVAPHFIAVLQQQRQQRRQDLKMFLFSAHLFPNHFFSIGAGNDGHRWLKGGNGDLSASACTKFEVALGCAIDCLNCDLETAVAECCNRFESEPSPRSTSTVFQICSQGMMHLLTTVIHPILTVMRFFDGNDNDEDAVDVGDECAVDVREQIFKTTLRLACSYWSRKKETTDARSRDLKVLFLFCRNSISPDFFKKFAKIFLHFEDRFL